MTTPTKNQMDRVTSEWSKIAGEELSVEFKGHSAQETPEFYAFGSELGCLRLYYKMGSGRVNFSKNLNIWYYANH